MSKQNKNNATCIICGKEYHLCIGCDRTKTNWKSWKMITDTENCYNIYKILNDYGYNKITKDEARDLLNKLDLSDVDSFKDGVKNRIKEIMKIDAVSKKKNKNKRPVKSVSENTDVKDVMFEEIESVQEHVQIKDEEIIAE